MNIKQGVAAAAVTAVALVGLALPAYAGTPGHAVLSQSKEKCEEDGGHVERNEAVFPTGAKYYCAGGDQTAEPITSDSDSD